ncbi:hypothetical protein [Spartinivicinus poritis]|uniref:Uncharacterized protein n=1 Tax=Spartinivicinus poritis TaxID=2994640 RepID=A0ABT5UHX5_9GAMM|nr:hypothetical protein [Spartinivicinus sp. A2-2]MDE1465953.1 hypothetical protein [Spartinivicinus sp. A2-2]
MLKKILLLIFLYSLSQVGFCEGEECRKEVMLGSSGDLYEPVIGQHCYSPNRPPPKAKKSKSSDMIYSLGTREGENAASKHARKLFFEQVNNTLQTNGVQAFIDAAFVDISRKGLDPNIINYVNSNKSELLNNILMYQKKYGKLLSVYNESYEYKVTLTFMNAFLPSMGYETDIHYILKEPQIKLKKIYLNKIPCLLDKHRPVESELARHIIGSWKVPKEQPNFIHRDIAAKTTIVITFNRENRFEYYLYYTGIHTNIFRNLAPPFDNLNPPHSLEIKRTGEWKIKDRSTIVLSMNPAAHPKSRFESFILLYDIAGKSDFYVIKNTEKNLLNTCRKGKFTREY